MRVDIMTKIRDTNTSTLLGVGKVRGGSETDTANAALKEAINKGKW
jgi:hypothetical protein